MSVHGNPPNVVSKYIRPTIRLLLQVLASRAQVPLRPLRSLSIGTSRLPLFDSLCPIYKAGLYKLKSFFALWLCHFRRLLAKKLHLSERARNMSLRPKHDLASSHASRLAQLSEHKASTSNILDLLGAFASKAQRPKWLWKTSNGNFPCSLHLPLWHSVQIKLDDDKSRDLVCSQYSTLRSTSSSLRLCPRQGAVKILLTAPRRRDQHSQYVHQPGHDIGER